MTRLISAFSSSVFSLEVKNLGSAPSLPVKHVEVLNWGHSWTSYAFNQSTIEITFAKKITEQFPYLPASRC